MLQRRPAGGVGEGGDEREAERIEEQRRDDGERRGDEEQGEGR